MSHNPKTICFVSWKKHKLDQALTQVDGVYNNYVDEVTFETIIDFFRNEYGFPSSLPSNEINQNLPIIPKSPYDITFESSGLLRKQVCPVCHDEINSTLFTNHLATKCFPECKNRLEFIANYFDAQKPEDSSQSQNT